MRINLFLSRHFGKNEEIADDLFYHLFITDKIGFGDKIELLDVVAKKYYPKLSERKPNYLNDLKKIIEHRNNFAHLHLDITNVGKSANIQGKVALAKYNKKDFVKPVIYGIEDVKKWLNLIYDYIEEMDKLINE